MLLTVACSLAAQSDDGGNRGFHKDLSKHKFNLRASVPAPKQVIVTPEQDARPCSIPLLQVKPPSKGTMRVIEPKPGSNMPVVQAPAPACKDWPTE